MWGAVLLCLGLVVGQPVLTEADCPAGPFKLHNFSYDTGAVEKEVARPYFIVLCDLSTTVRLDPLVHPDKLACHSHMHSVFGSNRFGPTVSLDDSTLGPEELANTTCHIPADGSMYWAPSMYFFNQTVGKYFLVPVYMKAYYLNRGATEPMALMPVGLRMLRGNPHAARPLVKENEIHNDSVNIFWYGSGDTGGFPNWLNKGDWQSRTMFPNCWDGRNLITTTRGENTHMAFRDNDGTCPQSHPVRIPQLFVEVNYQISYFVQRGGVKTSDFLLSTGDRRGWAAHVDYISGWNQDSLAAALNTCPNTDQTNPNCSFHQFSSVLPAAHSALTGGTRAGAPAASRVYKQSPVEEVDGLDQLLVTGYEANLTGFPDATCVWSKPRANPLPTKLMNTPGALRKTDCQTPSPPPGPAPPKPPPAPPGPPIPPGTCGTEHVNMDMDGTNGPGKQAKQATDCCDDCLADPGCDGVTFYNGYCYMKHHATKFVPNKGRSSAFVNQSHSA
jgi:hypothetical protein